MWRLSNYLSLECSAAVICSEFNTLQRYLVRDSRHLLKSTMKKEKKKTDVEDLEPPVVGMRPCRICRDIEYITMTDGSRTSTFALQRYLGRDSQHLLKSTMEKEKKKTDVGDLEHMNSISSLLFTKCGPIVKYRDFITFRQQLAREAQHLLDRQWRRKEKETTDLEDLRHLVVGVCPCRICRNIEYITTTDGPRTSTFAFSEILLPDQTTTTTVEVLRCRKIPTKEVQDTETS